MPTITTDQFAKNQSIGARELWYFSKSSDVGRKVMNQELVRLAKIYAKQKRSTSFTRALHKAATRLSVAYVSKGDKPIGKVSRKDRDEARKLFPPMVRGEVAAIVSHLFANAWKAGRFETILPKKHQKPTTRKAHREARQHVRPEPCPRGLEVQTLIFPAKDWTRKEARTWATTHGFKADKVDSTSTSYRIRQHPPSRYKKGKSRTISLGASGVKAVVGCPK